MQRITPEYLALNARAHADNNGYGVGGYKHLDTVLRLAESYGAGDVLDYGCGQGTLAKHAKRLAAIPFLSYDPAIPEFAAEPKPADMLVCTDVLEHVEPTCLMAVLEHMAHLTKKVAYLDIATRPAKRTLADGRNAHILIRDGYFWFDTLREYFDVVKFVAKPGHSVAFVLQPGGTAWKE